MLPPRPEGVALSVGSHGANTELWEIQFLVDIRR